MTRAEIEKAVEQCTRLPSLSTVSSALQELLGADQRYTFQISEVIRRDPSLTSRLLRLVNSVYYGLPSPVTSVEEAVFYIGIRQIRQLATVTPVIEDFQHLAGQTRFPWRAFWQHCLATALVTREVVSGFDNSQDDTDYIAGLIHDVGKIVIASSFPAHFARIRHQIVEGAADLAAVEREVIGLDHSEIGAMYLQQHRLSETLLQVAKFHHTPERATVGKQLVAAVQIADLAVRYKGIGTNGDNMEVTQSEWTDASGWNILFPGHEREKAFAIAHIERHLERLQGVIDGMV